MAWTNSKMFREWPAMVNQVSGTGYTGLDSDTIKAALYDNDITPDKDAALASTGFNTGQWATAGNEVTDATNWATGGRTLASKTITTPSSGVCRFDAADTAGGGTLTIANAYGCLVYDDSITAGSVAKQGVCYNYFGGAQSVTGGTFTIVWSANGIFEITT
jgi:hypothetical protein